MTWQEKIYSNLRVIEFCLGQDDDAALADACFMCQQAVEKLFNFSFMSAGKKMVRSHDIRILVEKAEELGLFVPTVVKDNAKELFDWETSTRYNVNFMVARKLVVDIFESCKEWVKLFERPVKRVNCFEKP